MEVWWIYSTRYLISFLNIPLYLKQTFKLHKNWKNPISPSIIPRLFLQCESKRKYDTLPAPFTCLTWLLHNYIKIIYIQSYYLHWKYQKDQLGKSLQKLLYHHEDFLPIFLNLKYVYVFPLVAAADLHLNNLENSKIFTTYHPQLI